MIDFSSQVLPGYGTRSLDGLIGIAVHHTVSPNKAWTLAEEEAHIRAIDADHSSSQKPWGGIGYSALIFPSGNIYTMGPLTQKRAGVTHRNAELASFAFVGNFTSERPTLEALDAGYELIDEWWQVLGQEMPVKGHRDWATADAPTACPGDTWREWILAIVAEEEPMPEKIYTQEDVDNMQDAMIELVMLAARFWRAEDKQTVADRIREILAFYGSPPR